MKKLITIFLLLFSMMLGEKMLAQPQICTAAFTWQSAGPNRIQLTDASVASSGVINSWTWTFTDASMNPVTPTFFNGTTASSRNPLVQFSSSGVYTACLTIGSDGGCAREYVAVACTQIPVGTTPPTNCSAAFTWNSSPGSNYTVAFTDASVTATPGVINSWNWTFYDMQGNPLAVTFLSGTASSASPVV